MDQFRFNTSNLKIRFNTAFAVLQIALPAKNGSDPSAKFGDRFDNFVVKGSSCLLPKLQEKSSRKFFEMFYFPRFSKNFRSTKKIIMPL